MKSTHSEYEESFFESEDSDVYRSSRQLRHQHKTQQLCRQAFRVLSGAVADLAVDPLLSSVFVESVEPAPDASRLMVRICADVPFEQALNVHNRLAAVKGRLRADLAAAISRKRAPDLVFCVVPSGAKGEL
jgi:ribosome-binding factor A